MIDSKVTRSTVPVSVGDELEPVGLHRVWSEYDRQVLVVDGVLPLGDDDSSSLLVESLAVPVRIELVQRVLDVVVLAHPDDVLRRNSAKLVHSTVAFKQRHTRTVTPLPIYAYASGVSMGPTPTRMRLSCNFVNVNTIAYRCLLYTSPSPRDRTRSRMPSSA